MRLAAGQYRQKIEQLHAVYSGKQVFVVILNRRPNRRPQVSPLMPQSGGHPDRVPLTTLTAIDITYIYGVDAASVKTNWRRRHAAAATASQRRVDRRVEAYAASQASITQHQPLAKFSDCCSIGIVSASSSAASCATAHYASAVLASLGCKIEHAALPPIAGPRRCRASAKVAQTLCAVTAAFVRWRCASDRR